MKNQLLRQYQKMLNTYKKMEGKVDTTTLANFKKVLDDTYKELST